MFNLFKEAVCILLQPTALSKVNYDCNRNIKIKCFLKRFLIFKKKVDQVIDQEGMKNVNRHFKCLNLS